MCVKRYIFLLSIVITGALKLAPAHAEAGLLVIGGSAAVRERTVVGAAIEGAVRKAGWSLPTKPLAKKDSDRLLGCEDSVTPWTCIPSTVTGAGIRDVLVVSVETKQAENGAPLVVITGKLIISNPQSFAVRQRFCEHCADDRLAEAGESLTHQLIQELAVRGGRTVVVIRSVPTTAELILDGNQVGATDATFNTFPGKHVAIVKKKGYISEVREFTVEQGKTADLSFSLRPAQPEPPPPPPPPPHHASSRWVPRIAVGAGAAVAVFGGISLYRGLTNGGPNGRYEYTHATVLGVVTGLVGVGAVGTGLYLMWSTPGDAATGPVPSPRTAIVGWSGKF